MEVVAAAPNGSGVPPFHDHDVREWSRLDSLTGVLERARLETDHWTANTSNSSHKYGKVVDSRARTDADGALQQQARRQLEVFQSHIPGGRLQVIKTHSVSTSRWSNNTKELPAEFENLQLSLNPLDLSSQKSKASVGRGVGRRPPSRPRDRHQIHDQFSNSSTTTTNSIVDIQEITSTEGKTTNNEKTHICRTKSGSSEDLFETSTKSTEDLYDLEQLQNWRRSSKLRRSLQHQTNNNNNNNHNNTTNNSSTNNRDRVNDLPIQGSVRKIREELEKGRRLSTALRGANNVDLEALDQILQSISSSSSTVSVEEDDNNSHNNGKQKRNSFVTVETLQEVRGRLRRTSSPSPSSEEKESDDGIVTEDNSAMSGGGNVPTTKVRSYVFGMENMLLNNKATKPMLGTGSLESRSKLLNGNTNLRNEDWYNRRKSYGFEQVHSSNVSLRNKSRVESSTDSGICRSSDKFPIEDSKVKQISSIFDSPPQSTTIKIPIADESHHWDEISDKEVKRHSIAVDESKYVDQGKYRKTSLASINPYLSGDFLSADNARRSKKVEFCKTEVHFAAESGKVNIVETDEKPPPTNNFRRRRRNSGPIIMDDGLPLLHFGDTSYEKSLLLGNFEDDDPSDENNITCGTVTVNTSYSYSDLEDMRKNEAIQEYNNNKKGILKNKPVKPIPYHLGEEFLVSSDSDSSKWGVRLKPVQKTPAETPFWKSTVTLHSPTIYGSEEQPEFQRMLKNLKSTSNNNKPDLLNINGGGNSIPVSEKSLSSVKFVTSTDNRRPSWSVADRVKLTEDAGTQWAENKVYSTTKINFGDGGTAVVENEDNWANESTSRKILNKGLVVRIGREDFTSTHQHTVCSKSSDPNSTTTTTKITIDLSPSPTNNNNPFKNSTGTKNDPPDNSCSNRSQSLFKSTSLILDTMMVKSLNTSSTNNNTNINNIPQQLEALKKLYENDHSDSDADKEVQDLMGKMVEEDDLDSIQDNTSEVSGSWSRMRAYKTVSEHLINKSKLSRIRLSDDAKIEKDQSLEIKSEPKTLNQSSKSYKIKLKDSPPTEVALSSPSLVVRNSYESIQQREDIKTVDTKLRNNTDKVVLRQPKKSEMTYFGVKAPPSNKDKVTKTEPVIISKLSEEKPDLLQHMVEKTSPRTRKKTPPPPIYENIRSRQHEKKQFDVKIMEELTKAADEILQAVNGFCDEEDDHSTVQNKAPLETINERKSLKNSTSTTIHKKSNNIINSTRTSRLRHASSNSSLDSVSPSHRIRKQATTKGRAESTSSTATTTTKTTKAHRRLQRASSREALLQSHGSSSEDLGANIEAVPLRKPRQIRKTKTVQLSISNGLEMKTPNPPRRRRNNIEGPKPNHERQKTTVRSNSSTAEKSTRDRSKPRSTRPRTTRDISSRATTISDSDAKLNNKSVSSSTARETVTHRISTANIKKCHRASDDRAARH